MVSGGLAYVCPAPNFWTATLKNAALNALTLGLAADTKDDKVRVNNFCIGIPIAEIGGSGKNQFGMEGPETRLVGPIFVAFAKGAKKGEIVNLGKPDQISELVSSLSK